MKLKNIPNPYDFANPVFKKSRFAGRRDVLDEIYYYVDLATNSDHPINLALLGERGSGKTSLLNIIEDHAKEKSICCVRVNLDESDVEDQFSFFIKLFEAILECAVKSGAFGGVNGDVYQTHLSITNTLKLPEDNAFMSFQFPVQYAQAVASSNQKVVHVRDNYISHDLKIIKDELNQPILLLLDECNVIESNTSILQKFRNIFMEQSGYMIVLSATPKLFPALDTVFSPIVRQFKRIEIKEFEDEDDTEDCIVKPIHDSKIEFRSVFRKGNPRYLFGELHMLTNGKPYEIQLICHAMFRRVQQGRSKHMALELPVLKEVRRELARLHRTEDNKVIDAIEYLDKENLEALAVYFEGGVTQKDNEIAEYEYILNGETRIQREEYSKYLEKFVGLGIFSKSEKGISFNGDQFDATYAKYFAKESDVGLFYTPMPAYISYVIRFRSIFYEIDHLLRFMFFSGEAESSLNSLIESMYKNNSDQVDLFKNYEFEMIELFAAVVNSYEKGGKIINFNFKILNEDMRSLSYDDFCYAENRIEVENALCEFFNPIKRRAQELDKDIELTVTEIDLPSVEKLLQSLNRSENEKARKLLAEKYLRSFYREYTDVKDRDKSRYFASIVGGINTELDHTHSNNLGYWYMVEGDYKQSEKLFTSVIDSDLDDVNSTKLISTYNLSMLHLKDNRLDETIALLDRVINTNRGESDIDLGASCLLKPIVNNREIGLVEKFDVDDIINFAKSSKTIIEEFQAKLPIN